MKKVSGNKRPARCRWCFHLWLGSSDISPIVNLLVKFCSSQSPKRGSHGYKKITVKNNAGVPFIKAWLY